MKYVENGEKCQIMSFMNMINRGDVVAKFNFFATYKFKYCERNVIKNEKDNHNSVFSAYFNCRNICI